MTRLLLLLAGALAILATVPLDVTADDPTVVASSEPEEVSPREQLALARVLASEIGWEPTDEAAAIHQVLEDRSRQLGLSYLATVCAYSSRTCDPERTDARRWIAHLRPSGARPDGWPATASWARHRGRWLALYRHAGEVLRGRVASPCAGPVHHWGMPRGIDLRRALAAGWIRVECPGARNAFWRVPSRAELRY